MSACEDEGIRTRTGTICWLTAHARTFNPCDQKLTPQLERKRYFEEKARDARDECDDLNLINDSMVRPRVISAGIGFGPGSGSNNLDPKQMKILRFE